MWLITMATLFVAPQACASSGHSQTVESVPSCHAAAPAAAHCESGGACCPADPAGQPADTSPHACLSAANQAPDPAIVTVDMPTRDLAAAILPVPAPWVFIATDTEPHTPATLLPPRDVAASPQGSRAPPAYLA